MFPFLFFLCTPICTPLGPLFCVLMHQVPSKTSSYIQLLPRFAGLTLILKVTSSRKPTLLLLSYPARFHLAPHALKKSLQHLSQTALAFYLLTSHTDHMLLEAAPCLAHPIPGTCLAVLSTYLWVKNREHAKRVRGTQSKQVRHLRKRHWNLYSGAPVKVLSFPFLNCEGWPRSLPDPTGLRCNSSL